MKKLLLIITIAGALFAEKVTMTMGANVRSGPSIKSNVIDVVKRGEIYPVLDKYADYYYLEIIPGQDKKSTSDHVGKKGYMWSERVQGANVIIEGCTLRSTPEKRPDNTPDDTADDHNFIAKVKKGATIRVIRKNYIWILIPKGWVTIKATKKVKTLINW